MKSFVLTIICMLFIMLVLGLNCQYASDLGPAPYTPPALTGEAAMKHYVDSILQTKSATDSLSKAAANLKTNQQAYVDMKFGMFVHFSMSTFDRCCCTECYGPAGEWGYPASASVVPNKFHPQKLDIGQWAKVAKSAGMKYMVLTTKHHDGFCTWPSKFNKHNVKYSSWANGNRDVLREYVDTLTKYGIKVGIYYSIWDKTTGSSIPFIRAQLTELLTNYGPITELYFDGWGWVVKYTKVPFDTINNLVKTLQPNCLIMENNHEKTMKNTDVITYEIRITGAPPEGNTIPSEGGLTIRTDDSWFWHPDLECEILSAQKIVDELTLLNSRNTSFLLDLGPDTLGLMPSCIVERMAEVGKLRGVTAP